MPRKPSIEVRAKKYMNLLNVSYEEAVQMVKDDDIIDNGGRCDWEPELTPEQKKIVRRARMADREVKKEKQKRTRKENPDKQELIKVLEDAIGEKINYTEDAPSLQVINAEREITFTYHGTPYKITLSAPRAPKE